MSRYFPSTISRYLAFRYTISFLQILAALLAIVYLFDTVELLRRAAKFDNVPLSLVLQMGLLKLPDVGQIVLPFAILFSALYTFWLLARRQELVIIRAAGMSVWRFLGPIVFVALLIGVIHITVINPISAVLISRYQVMETEYLQAKENTVSVGEQGLWLRQKTDDGGIILHADRVKMPEWKLNGVSVFYFDKQGDFVRRIDSSTADLEPGEWIFKNLVVNRSGAGPEKKQFETLPTDLTITEIEDSFSTPEQTPFWTLPAYIRTMEATGFDSRTLRIHYHTLLAQPLLFAAMIILAATVSLKLVRTNSTALMIGGGVVIGFLVFFATSFLKALGASDQIPVLLAAWFPPLIALTMGVSVILTTEDG